MYRQGISRWLANLVVAGLVLPLAQMQHMHDVGWISILGTVGMVTAVLIVLAKLIALCAPALCAASCVAVCAAHA